MVEGTCVLPFVFTAIVKGGVQCVMASNYGGFSSRGQHQMVRLSAFVAGGIQAEQRRERLMHTAAFSSSLNAHLYVINGLSEPSGQTLQQ